MVAESPTGPRAALGLTLLTSEGGKFKPRGFFSCPKTPPPRSSRRWLPKQDCRTNLPAQSMTLASSFAPHRAARHQAIRGGAAFEERKLLLLGCRRARAKDNYWKLLFWGLPGVIGLHLPLVPPYLHQTTSDQSWNQKDHQTTTRNQLSLRLRRDL